MKLKMKPSRGFTLIEILVVVGILAIIVIISSTSFFNLLKGSTKTRAANLVKQEGDYALGIMTKMVRNTRGILRNTDSPPRVCVSGMSKLKIKNPDGGETEFECDSSAISSTSAETGSQVPITSDQVAVESCRFDCVEGGYFDPDVVTIDFTLSTGALSPFEERAIINFKTTVVLRNISED